MNFKKFFKKKAKPADPQFVVTPKQKPILGKYHVGATLRGLFFFLLVTIPLGIFAYVIYHSSGLSIYQHYVYVMNGKHVWNQDGMNLPNAYNIFILFWVGMGCLIATALMICTFGVITKFVDNKRIQTAYVFGIIFLAVIGILLAALAQYFYAKFYDFYLYEAKTTSDEGRKPWAVTLSAALSQDYKDHNQTVFDWMQSSVVWWVMFVQFMFVFSVEVTLQNALNDKSNLNDYEKYIADTKQEDAGIDFSKVNRFFRNMFKNSDKTIAKFLIVAAVVIVIPNFVYSIIGTVETTNSQAVIAWSYKVPTLINDMSLNSNIKNILSQLNGAKYGSIFLVSSLPIIVEGLTISTLFLFIATLLRGKNVSNRIFIIEAGILFVELMVLISVALASKIYLHRLADFWSTANGSEDNIKAFTNDLKDLFKNGQDFAAIENMYPLNGIENTNSIHVEWLNMAASIAEAVIAYAWVFGCFTLIGNNIYKLGYFKKANFTTYTSGILNS